MDKYDEMVNVRLNTDLNEEEMLKYFLIWTNAHNR